MKVIVGLGNPGRIYQKSRHNVGISVVNSLAKKCGIKLTSEKSALYKYGRGKTGNIDFTVAYPTVFMNLSGRSAASLLSRLKVKPQDLLVVCDDLDLALGKVRIRPRGSSGGHKGLKSIIECLGSEGFARLRVGIGRPVLKHDVADFVLSGFNLHERGLIIKAVQSAVLCCEAWISEGIDAAMEKFNRRVKQ